MNNKTIIFSLLLLTLAFFTPIAKAEDPTATNSPKPKFFERMEEKKASREAFLQAIKDKKEEFKTKLSLIKDERKQKLAEKANEKFASVNKAATDRMNLSIEKLEKLLDKFASRAAVLKSEGKDTSEVDSAVDSAEEAIADAKVAVASQAAIVYTAEITDETGLKNAFGKTMVQLREDLKATHDVVKDAKQKVIDVARALSKLTKPTPTI